MDIKINTGMHGKFQVVRTGRKWTEHLGEFWTMQQVIASLPEGTVIEGSRVIVPEGSRMGLSADGMHQRIVAG